MTGDVVRGFKERLEAALVGFRATAQSERSLTEAFDLHVIYGSLALRNDYWITRGRDGIFKCNLNDVVFFEVAHTKDESLRHALGIEANGILRGSEGCTGKIPPNAHPARLRVRPGRVLDGIGQRGAGKRHGFGSLGGVTAGNFEVG